MELSSNSMKYLFGPVNSRRLGLSLGIDLLPEKICNYNCIYCEVGPKNIFTCERKEYTPTTEIIAEIDSFQAAGKHKPIDIFTITASGEPTLHSGLGKIIGYLKKQLMLPVAVLTNGSLLFDPQVRQDLLEADIVIPSLDAAQERSFRKINRPVQGCPGPEEIINGLSAFSDEFQGSLWLEILLAKGINDSAADIEALKNAAARINPEKIQLNTVVRPPVERYAFPLTENELREISREFPGTVEIIADFDKKKREDVGSAERTEIVEMLQRRPCTENDICQALNLDQISTAQLLSKLAQSGVITKVAHGGKSYYQTSQTA